MNVLVRSFGILKNYFGDEAETIVLPAGATLRDLIEKMEARWHESIPDHLWDSKKHWFRGPVVIMIDGHAVRDRDTPLRDQQEVGLFKAVVGG